jgi:hypothetical protein
VHAETIAIGARRLLKPAAFGDLFSMSFEENKCFVLPSGSQFRKSAASGFFSLITIHNRSTRKVLIASARDISFCRIKKCVHQTSAESSPAEVANWNKAEGDKCVIDSQPLLSSGSVRRPGMP